MTQSADSAPITEEMLHAFVDGQLSAADAARVEDWLAENPDQAEEVAAWMDQNAALRDLFAPSGDMPDLSIAPANNNTPPARTVWLSAAAAMVALVVGLSGGWFARGSLVANDQMIGTLVREAVTAHLVYSVDPHRPVEVAASEEETLIRWLSNRVGHQLAAPDLTAQGYELVGGRLVSVTEGPAAQFMYENAAGERITLFASKGATGQLASFSFNQQGETGSFYWEDADLSYAIVGDVDRDALNSLALAVYNQL